MTNKDFKANTTAVIITVISLFLLVISSIFSLYSRVSEKDMAAMEQTAQKLVEANFDTVSYFKLASLPAAADYDPTAYPEGVVPCDTAIFSSYKELTEFVYETYTPTTAALLLNAEIDGKKRYFEQGGKLCMNQIEPVLTYDKDWTNFSLKLTAVKRGAADIDVTVHTKDGTPSLLTLHMVKEKDSWRLTDVVY